MKNIITKAILSTLSLGVTITAFAGNKDRAGQAGATEMLINPWAQSTGVFGLDVANVRGLAAMKVNIAGLSFAEDLELGVSHTRYLSGSGISINNAGMAYRLGEGTVMGVNAMSMSFGEIDVTDIDHPEGNGAKYRPSFLNVSLGFSHKFSDRIRGGVNGTFITEQIGNIGAVGAAIDAGIQYVTGKDENMHIGVTLRNAGTNMRFSGGGFSSEGEAVNSSYAVTRSMPQEKFQLPTYMSMGFAYDFYLDEKNRPSDDVKPLHRLTAMANFTSNSFNNDYLGAGSGICIQGALYGKGAYRYEKDIMDKLKSTTFYTGLSMGATVSARIGKSGPLLLIDYSFRPTQRPANGVHVFGLRFNFLGKKSGLATPATDATLAPITPAQ